MYFARLVHFKLGMGQRRVAEQLTHKFDKISRTLDGFRGNVYFFDDPSGEYRALNYWDTKEEAEAANSVLFPKLETELKPFTTEKPTFKYFEVFDASDQGGLLISHIKL